MSDFEEVEFDALAMETFEKELKTDVINGLVKEIHKANVEAGWWKDAVTGKDLRDDPHVIATKLLLVVSEISEATEAYRKGLNDDKLIHRSGIEVELADAVIRIMDLCGVLKLDLGGAIEEKRTYNSSRQDHKIENRAKQGGKKF